MLKSFTTLHLKSTEQLKHFKQKLAYRAEELINNCPEKYAHFTMMGGTNSREYLGYFYWNDTNETPFLLNRGDKTEVDLHTNTLGVLEVEDYRGIDALRHPGMEPQSQKQHLHVTVDVYHGEIHSKGVSWNDSPYSN